MYQLIQKFLFFFKAQTAHGLHSPLVFELYTKVINPNLWPFQKDQLIENLEKFILSKFELKEFKLLQINTLNELSILIPQKTLLSTFLNLIKTSNIKMQLIHLHQILILIL